MKEITWNKGTAVCLVCGKNRVPMKKWNKPCSVCAKNFDVLNKSKGFSIGRRQPAAVVEDDNGNKIFVDKFGEPVEDHDYDLDENPKGINKPENRRDIII